MFSERADHGHEGSCIFPETDKSNYSTDNNLYLITIFVKINFILFAALLLNILNEPKTLISTDEVSIDSKRDQFLSKFHLHELFASTFVEYCFVELLKYIHVHLLQGIASQFDSCFILKKKENYITYFVGSHSALVPGTVTGEVILELNWFLEHCSVVVFLYCFEDSHQFALQLALPVNKVSYYIIH